MITMGVARKGQFNSGGVSPFGSGLALSVGRGLSGATVPIVLLGVDAGASTLMRQVSFEANMMGGQVTKSGLAISAFSKTLKGMIGVTAIAAAGITIASSRVLEFQDRIAAISAITGTEFQKTFDTVGNNAIKLSQTLAFSADEILEASQTMAQAGFNPEEIVKATKSIGELAKATNESFTTATQIAITTMQAYGMEINDITHLTNVLTFAVNASPATLDSLGESLKHVTPISSKLGISIESLTANLIVMSKAGLKGSIAGTSLATALQQILQPSQAGEKKFSVALKATRSILAETGDLTAGIMTLITGLGGSVDEVANALQIMQQRGIVNLDVLDNKTKDWIDSNEAIKRQYELIGKLIEITTIRSSKGLLALIGNLKDAQRNTLALELDITTAERATQTRQLSARQQIQILKNQFNAPLLGGEFSEGLTRALTQLASSGAVDRLGKSFDNLAGGLLRGVIPALQTFVELATEVLKALESFKGITSAVVGTLKTLVGLFNSIPGPFKELAATMLVLNKLIPLQTLMLMSNAKSWLAVTTAQAASTRLPNSMAAAGVSVIGVGSAARFRGPSGQFITPATAQNLGVMALVKQFGLLAAAAALLDDTFKLMAENRRKEPDMWGRLRTVLEPAIAGAALGTIIAPGPGTLAGFGAGAIGGGLDLAAADAERLSGAQEGQRVETAKLTEVTDDATDSLEQFNITFAEALKGGKSIGEAVKLAKATSEAKELGLSSALIGGNKFSVATEALSDAIRNNPESGKEAAHFMNLQIAAVISAALKQGIEITDTENIAAALTNKVVDLAPDAARSIALAASIGVAKGISLEMIKEVPTLVENIDVEKWTENINKLIWDTIVQSQEDWFADHGPEFAKQLQSTILNSQREALSFKSFDLSQRSVGRFGGLNTGGFSQEGLAGIRGGPDFMFGSDILRATKTTRDSFAALLPVLRLNERAIRNEEDALKQSEVALDNNSMRMDEYNEALDRQNKDLERNRNEMDALNNQSSKNSLEISRVQLKAKKEGRDLTEAERERINNLSIANDEIGIHNSELQLANDAVEERIKSMQAEREAIEKERGGLESSRQAVIDNLATLKDTNAEIISELDTLAESIQSGLDPYLIGMDKYDRLTKAIGSLDTAKISTLVDEFISLGKMSDELAVQTHRASLGGDTPLVNFELAIDLTTNPSQAGLQDLFNRADFRKVLRLHMSDALRESTKQFGVELE